MATDTLVEAVALVALASLIAYAVLGGADFGGGLWDLVAHGSRSRSQREAIAGALGPVWEANHVWLIFLIVILFTAFPTAFALLSVVLYWPFHLVLLGIVLRGAAFVFSAPGRAVGDTPIGWGVAFGGASIITPCLLGMSLAAISAGQIRTLDGVLTPGSEWAWLGVFPVTTGALALAVCAYLAAVYLTLETDGELQDDFRRRALTVWVVGGALALVTLLLTSREAPHLWNGLTRGWSALVIVAGILLAVASALAVWSRHFHAARVAATGQVTFLLLGWALAQRPYIIYPDMSYFQSAAPDATLRFFLLSLPVGLGLLLPSLWFLFAVFKGRNPAAMRSDDRERDRNSGT